jgi:hypothetical protein
MFVVGIVQGIINIQAEHSSHNKPVDKEAPPIIPSNVVRVQPVVFARNVLQPRSVHLMKVNWDEDAIYKIK